MAYKEGNGSAYNGNAARQLAAPAPKRVSRKQAAIRDNVIRLTEKELRHARRKNLNPLKIVATLLCVTVIFSLVAYSVYGQVQLTELTEEINVSTQELSQLQSVEVQLEMLAVSNMNVSEMEEFAKNQLGMEKVMNNQITYVNLAESDKGAVLVEDGGNFFEKLLHAIGF